MPPKIERVPLHQIPSGQLADFFALLCERTQKSTREGKPFFSVKFRDRYRTVTTPIWENSPLFEHCEQDWKTGQHFKIRGVYTEHERFGPQIEIHNIRLATSEDWVDGYDPNTFVIATRFDVEELFQELIGAAQAIENAPLRRLVAGLLEDHEEEIKQATAARRNHHAFRGGFLEHTVSVLRTGLFLVEKYRSYYSQLKPPLNKDLVVAGCILHDIGKLVELEGHDEDTKYSIPGNLVGHIILGRDMVREAARTIPDLSPELLLYLDHIILAHQGQPEWGSPKEPMLPEALLVHHADDLDAKMNIIVNALERSEGDADFTDHSNAMRRKILRKRTV